MKVTFFVVDGHHQQNVLLNYSYLCTGAHAVVSVLGAAQQLPTPQKRKISNYSYNFPRAICWHERTAYSIGIPNC